MFHRLAEISMAILFVFALYTTVIASTENERKQLPPPSPEHPYSLETFDVGVPKVLILGGLHITYINERVGDEIITRGKLKFNRHKDVNAISLQYLIVDKDHNPSMLVNLLLIENPKEVTLFEVRYPFNGNYKYTLFLINFDVKKTEPKPPPVKGEDTINV